MLRHQSIANFFNKKHILVTGGTGFLGMVLVEKLLRSFPDIDKIYLLIRGKKSENAIDRSNKYFNHKLFSTIKNINPTLNSKIQFLEGNICDTNLGLPHDVTTELQKSLNIIVHSAATIKFNEPIKTAIDVNIRGSKNVLELAKLCENIESYVHVSTVYTNHKLGTDNIEERIYPHPIEPELLLELPESTKNTLYKSETELISGWPNTYIYTKNAAENLVNTYRNLMPIGIYRPGTVLHSHFEPFPYWKLGNGGLIKILEAYHKGYVFGTTSEVNANTVPVDMTVNGLLASIMDVSINRANNDVKIYNYTTNNNPCTYGDVEHYYKQGVNDQTLEFGNLKYKAHMYAKALNLLAKGVKIQDIIKSTSKIDKIFDVMKGFFNTKFEYDNNNIEEVWRSLDDDGKKLLPFNINEINWKNYYMNMYEHTKENLLD